MSDLVRFVFSAGGIAVFALAGVSWVCCRPRSKSARRFAVSGAVFYTLATIYATSFLASRLLVAGFQPLAADDVPPGRVALVILGSGSYTIHDWDGGEYSTTDAVAASRVLEAVRIYRLLKPELVISSGGKGGPDDPAVAPGIAMRDLLLQLGVPADRIVAETRPRNTYEEAVAAAESVARSRVEHVVIVTSDFHMRRSLGTFRSAGIRGIPAIVKDPFPPEGWRDWLLPSQDGLWRSDIIAHEILGLAYYAVRGWYRF
jgi:uncharacterized SAM-binding protein YcdF (DUF218 family)